MVLALVAAVQALGVLPGVAFGERGPLRVASKPSAEEPNGPQVIVKYRALGGLMRAMHVDGAGRKGPQYATEMGRRTGLALTDGRIIEGRSQVVRGAESQSSTELAARLAADPEVEYAVPDQRRFALALPNDPLYAAGTNISPQAGQWYLRAPDATFVSAINAAGAWNLSTGSAGIVVADVDTGVRFNHPDLANKLYPGYDFITDASNAGDGNARDSDAGDPGDWTSANECGFGAAATSSSWHGTQTSSLIGAQSDNGVGMASAGRDVMVLPVRVLGKCGGSDSDIIAAMLWAGGVSSNPLVNPHPARVINLSLGGSGSCNAAYADAIRQLTAAGVVVVASAGNDEGLAVGVPANCSGVIAVAGVRHTGTKVGFSSIGPEVSISAPAGNCVNTSGACLYPILTATDSGATNPLASTYSDSSNYSVGTSFSAPLVAGTVALMFSVNPALTPTQVRSLLQSRARPFPTTSTDPTVQQCHAPSSAAQDECFCTTSTCGAGLLDAAGAVSAAVANAQPKASVNASAPTVLVGGAVSFDGRASVAPSGRTISAYQWSITSGSAIAKFSSATDGATASVLASDVGSFTVQLTVTDSAGQKASSSSTVTVNAPAPTAPSVKLLSSATVVAAGDKVSFDGSTSSAASGLSIASYQWSITSGASLATFTTPTHGATASVATLGTGSGSFTVRLTVTDSLNQQSSAISTVNVTALAPTASIGASSASVTAGGSVTFDGSGSKAPAGRILSAFQWTITSGGAIATFRGPATAATATVDTSAAGTFTVQLTVTDSGNAQDNKVASVTVNAAPAPVAGGGSSGGGGVLSGAWIAWLALAVVALRRCSRPEPGR